VTLTRVAAAGVLVPVFAPGLMQPVVRNSAFVGLSLIVLIWRPVPLMHMGLGAWLAIFGRELFIGLSIGALFSGVIWALEIAGGYIDRKVSPNGGLTDPFTGGQSGTNQAFLSQLGAYVFAASGGLMLLVTTLLQSYAWFPVSPTAPGLPLHDSSVFTAQFQRIMALSLAFAAPALILLTTAEAAMGLIGRFAPQLNVFAASMAIKSWLATFILLAIAGLLVQTLTSEILQASGGMRVMLGRLADLP
jgi:type III secretion protein T